MSCVALQGVLAYSFTPHVEQEEQARSLVLLHAEVWNVLPVHAPEHAWHTVSWVALQAETINSFAPHRVHDEHTRSFVLLQAELW